MTGQDLHQLILSKWGYSYDIQLRRIKGRIFVQIMWRYLEQVSFPLTEREYLERLDAIAEYLNGWGAIAQFHNFIARTKERPRLGKAVSIPIELGARTSEWILDEG